MRFTSLLLSLVIIFSTISLAQDAQAFTEVIGKNLGDVNLKKLVGNDTETQHLSNWAISAKSKGIKVRAVYDRKRTDYSGKIYSIEFYFTKKGMDKFMGELLLGLNSSMSWKKCLGTLRKHPDVLELGSEGGKVITFQTEMEGQTINFEVAYPSGTSMQSFKMMVPEK